MINLLEYGLEEEATLRVLDLVKEEKIAELIQLLEKLDCSDLFSRERNPSTILAEQCNHAAITFLRTTFSANINPITRGYAMANETELVDGLLAEGSNPNCALIGYAIKGHHKHVETLLAKGNNINFALCGYAMAKNEEKIEELLKRGAKIFYRIDGYLQGGHFTEALKYIKLEKPPRYAVISRYRPFNAILERVGMLDSYQAHSDKSFLQIKEYLEFYYHSILEGRSQLGHARAGIKVLSNTPWEITIYAQEGYLNKINAYLDKVSDKKEYLNSLSKILEGFALAGNSAQIESYLSKAEAMTVYSQKHVQICRRGLAEGLAEVGLICFLNKYNLHDCKKEIGLQLKQNYSRSDVLLLLSSINNSELRSYLAGSDWLNATSLLPKAAKINSVINELNFTFYQAKGYLILIAKFNWFLIQVYANKTAFPDELANYIFSYVTQCSTSDTSRILDTANMRIKGRIESSFKFFADVSPLSTRVIDEEDQQVAHEPAHKHLRLS